VFFGNPAMNLNSVRNVKLPNPGPAGALAKVALYNVDGGHRAIVFNRLIGVKEQVIFVLLFDIATT
jgi:prohibitin 2